MLSGHAGAVRALAFVPSLAAASAGEPASPLELLSASEDGTVRRWAVGRGVPAGMLQQGAGPVTALAVVVARKGASAEAAAGGRKLQLWQWSSTDVLKVRHHTRTCAAIFRFDARTDGVG